jgi:exodeoxyribonuclease V gamma subunit
LSDTAATPATGFVVLHGNRLEDLAEVVLDWQACHPPAALEPEHLLVPSSGMAEWLKGAIATRHGVAAGFVMELPAQFAWRCLRAVLGPAAVPAASPLDKAPLAWRLMRLLPRLAAEPGYAALDGFLRAAPAGTAPMRQWQLARRLADLLDQYQVYRPDWLADWAAGDDRLRAADGAPGRPVPPGQRWQCALWRTLRAELLAEAAAAGRAAAPDQARPALQAQALATLGAAPAGSRWPGLPTRLLLFGTTQLPHATLELLGALSRHAAVLLAVPDPCRQAWADAPRGEVHPLLQAWGRQCRDFVRQLAAFDDERAAQRLGLPRIEVFDDVPGQTVLQQLQARIRDGIPEAAEQPVLPRAPDDLSLAFHLGHGPLREVEALHDQLLERLGQRGPGPALEPRDIVVMVPDIERFAPAIGAVFGRFAPGHPRHIPWGLADRRERGRSPLLQALEALLRVRERRWTHSEITALLATPAVARRLGLEPGEIDQLGRWLQGAGARWGLDEAQRQSLGLGAAGGIGSLRFAIDRMFMGYATGALPAQAEPLAGIEPYTEVAGLEAALAGVLAQWAGRLQAWWQEAATPRSPQAWRAVLQALMADFFDAGDDAERSLLGQLDTALRRWLDDCERARFAEPLPLALVRETWLDGLDEAGGGRFRAGGVTFCTLLPLRAIPFRVVALLGMNDGDYPRPASRSDFDLMAEPAQARPGDRSRRDDDRQLMLDALLAAREALIVSWSGFAARDGQPQPPSVLVAQLRDQVRTLWGEDTLAAMTTTHPLQPFARAYFEGRDTRLFTHALEWRALHEAAAPAAAAESAGSTPWSAPTGPLRLQELADFVLNPVKAFFRQRLRADLQLAEDDEADDEVFAEGGLEGWAWNDELLRQVVPVLASDTPAPALAAEAARVARRLAREGRLPWGGPGQQAAARLVDETTPMLQAWVQVLARHGAPAAPEPLQLVIDGVVIDAGSVALSGHAGECWLLRHGASRLAQKPKAKLSTQNLRADKLVADWLWQLALAAAGRPAALWRVAPDGVVEAAPIEPALAREQLKALLHAWHEGASPHSLAPLPTAVRTGLAWFESPEAARQAFEGSGRGGEGDEPHLARCYTGFAALRAEPGFEAASRRLYGPLQTWLQGLALRPLDGAAAADDEDADGRDD